MKSALRASSVSALMARASTGDETAEGSGERNDSCVTQSTCVYNQINIFIAYDDVLIYTTPL